MSGDPFYTNNYTRTYCTHSCTTSTDDTEVTLCRGRGTTSWASIDHSYENRLEEVQKIIKDLLRKEKILKMKRSWVVFKNTFYPMPPVRPEIRLRGVCLNGRGWA